MRLKSPHHRQQREDKSVFAHTHAHNLRELLQVLEILMKGVAHSLTADELVGVADSAHGFTGSDLKTVCMLGMPLQ